MAGSFLPPVVVELDGDIQPLLDKLAEAKAAINALGKTKITIPVNVDLNQASVNKAMGAAKAAASKGVSTPLKAQADPGSLADALSAMQAAASAIGITVPVRFSVDSAGFISVERAVLAAGREASAPRAITAAAPSSIYAISSGPERLALPPGTSNNETGFFGSFADTALGRLASRATTLGPNREVRPLGFLPAWLGGGLTYTQFHSALLGIGALALGTVGAGLGLGSMAATMGTGYGNAYTRGSELFGATEAQIPPGVPDYALARAFGLTGVGPNSVLAKAGNIGSGQALSSLGQILALANKKGPLSSLVAQYGNMGGSTLDNMLAELVARPSMSKSNLSKIFGETTADASNILQSIGNLLAFGGHALSHLPGEIEWGTTALRNVTGWANDIWSVPVLKTVVGDSAFSFFLAHSMGLVTKYARNVMSGIPGLKNLVKAPVVDEETGEVLEAGGPLAALGTDAGLFGTTGFAGKLLNPFTLGTAAVVGAYLAMRRTNSPTSAAIKAINSGLYNTTTANYGNNILRAMDYFSNGAANGSTAPETFIGSLLHMGSGEQGMGNAVQNFLTAGLFGRTAGSKYQNEAALSQAETSFLHYGAGVNAVASALGVSDSEAAQIMGLAGVQMGSNGKLVGGLARAVALSKAFMNANKILNGTRGQTAANMAIAGIVGDSAWTQTQTINSNWDTYMTALGSGYSGLSGILTDLGKTGSVGTQQAIAIGNAINSTGAEQIADFFRQAQSVGAIGGGGLSKSILDTAAALGPLAGNSKAAQAELVALANQSGVNVKSFKQLMEMTGGSKNAMKDLTDSISETTVKMARVPAAMQSTMTKVTSDLSADMAAIVAKNKNAQTAFHNLLDATERWGTGSTQAYEAGLKLVAALEKDGMSANEARAAVQALGVQTGITTGMLHKLADAWAGIKPGSKVLKVVNQNIIDTIYEQQGNPAAEQSAEAQAVKAYGRGHAAGGIGLPAGWSWVGELGPELMYVPGGSSILPNSVANRMNQGHGGSANTHVHVYLDGKEIFKNIKSQVYQYNVNNGNRSGRGMPRGTMVPR